jgi:uncharacterized surface anchored protein
MLLPTLNASKRQPWLLVLSLFLLLAACAKTPTGPEPTPGTVSGILQSPDGYAVPEAVVDAYNVNNQRISTDTTRDDGAFTLKNLPNDLSKVNLRISHVDYQTTSIELSSALAKTGGNTTGIPIVMDNEDSCCGTLIVSVTSGGTALNEAQVRVRRGDHTLATGYTNDHGLFVMHHVCPGEYNLRVAKTGYSVSEPTFTLTECDSVEESVSLTQTSSSHDTCCGGTFRINVTDSASGESITSGTVTMSRSGVTRTATVNDHGYVIFHEVCAGQYVFHISREHYRTIEFTETMHCNDSITMNRVLAQVTSSGADSCCGGSITLYVRDSASNELLNSGTANLWHGSTMLQSRTVSSSGTHFEHLCQGTYQISLSRDGYHSVEFNVEVGCNEAVSVTRLLAAIHSADSCCSGVVELVVRDSTTNAVVHGATVKLYRSGTLLRTETTNADGGVRMINLCNGNYRMTVDNDGYGQRVIEFELGCSQARGFATHILATAHDTCCNAIMRVTVLDSLHSTNLSGATVTIRYHDVTIDHGTTNADGVWAADGLCGNRTYVVTISKDGYNTKSINWTFTDCHTYTETFRLSTH